MVCGFKSIYNKKIQRKRFTPEIILPIITNVAIYLNWFLIII